MGALGKLKVWRTEVPAGSTGEAPSTVAKQWGGQRGQSPGPPSSRQKILNNFADFWP